MIYAMNIKIKICGITNREDALLCAESGADALGFIFYRQSPRYVSPEAARTIINVLPPFITPVGVFVNESRMFIQQIIERTGIRVLQLSGDELPEECRGYLVPVIKAFRIRTMEEVKKVEQYEISSAMLDGAPDGQYGGSGILPDVSVAREIKKFHPLILAGGLHPGTVAETIETVQPYAVDINSGVESSPGKKDHYKVKLLFERCSSFHSIPS